MLLAFQAACLRPATRFPRSSVHQGRSLAPVPWPKAPSAQVDAVEVLEPSGVATRPVPVDRVEFQQALQRLAQHVRLEGSPRQAAQALLVALRVQQEASGSVSAGGDYLAEVSRGRVLSLVPQHQWGGASLTPVAEERLRVQYQQWCQKHGGGDCLGLFEDGASFLTDDRRALALALALDSVLDETRAALARELDPRLLVALVVWSAVVYLGLLLVPEPVTKALAASLTVVLVAVLGLSTFWALIDGWAHMATRAHLASTFEELREAGQEYAQVLGTTAARALILAVATGVSGPLGQLAARVRAMPAYPLAQAQWRAQGGAMALEEAVALAQEGTTAVALQAVEVAATSPQGALTLVMLKKGATGGGTPRNGRTTTVLRHRGGNKQVLTERGERWHLSRDKAAGDIPLRDPVGDQLQEAVTQAAREWGPHRLSPQEQGAIERATQQGKYWLARLLEHEARGRFVHARVKAQFEELYQFNPWGVDVVDLKTGLKYEILSGTQSNLALHGRRMSSEFFRMLTF
jgi:small basic protein